MPRAKTPSFVCEFEVSATSKDLRVLRSRKEAGRQIYHAIEGEALRRLARMRHDPGFEQAKAMPKGTEKKAAFEALRKRHGFTEASLHQHPSLAKDCWLRGHLDVHTQQKVATRAFRAVERWSFGGSGKPRFKRYGEMESLEGKSNAAGIRFRDGRVLWAGAHGNLDLPLIVKAGDEVQAHALQVAGTTFTRTTKDGRTVQGTGVKYCRLLTRTIRGHERAFVQLVLRGVPLQKPKNHVHDGLVGLDLGPSRVAVVGEGFVKTIPFCPDLDRTEAARRRYLRKLDRQRRANNPGNYRPNGTVKPRSQRKPWQASARQKFTQGVLAELLRGMAAHRKSLQGKLVNDLLALAGNQVITEQVNVRSWAKLWGRSVGHKAPGLFQSSYGRKAEASGGSMEMVSTKATYLSSRCLCGKRTKKLLSERKHTCGCEFIPEGMHTDRDEFSAFLALHCQGGTLDEGYARESWLSWGANCLLRLSSGNTETANGKATPTLRVRGTRRSSSTDHKAGQRREAVPVLRTDTDGERRDRKIPKPRKPWKSSEVPDVA